MKFDDQLARLRPHKKHKKFADPGFDFDRLYKPAYHHIGKYGYKCMSCTSLFSGLLGPKIISTLWSSNKGE